MLWIDREKGNEMRLFMFKLTKNQLWAGLEGVKTFLGWFLFILVFLLFIVKNWFFILWVFCRRSLYGYILFYGSSVVDLNVQFINMEVWNLHQREQIFICNIGCLWFGCMWEGMDDPVRHSLDPIRVAPPIPILVQTIAKLMGRRTGKGICICTIAVSVFSRSWS